MEPNSHLIPWPNLSFEGMRKTRGLRRLYLLRTPQFNVRLALIKEVYRMDMWKFFDITHREHILCNPMSLEKLEQLITLLPLKPGARVLDIATGKGEFLIRLAERHRQMTGTGVDFSPYCIADVHKKQ